MKKLLLTVSFICFAAGYEQAQAQVSVDVNVGAPVYPAYVRTGYYPTYYRDRGDYDWRYWNHDRDDDDHDWDDHHDNGKHKGWYKHGRHGDRD